MENLKICPRCHKIMAYNSYFQKYYCSNCGHMSEPINNPDARKETKP